MRVSVRADIDGKVVGEARERNVAVQLAGQENAPGLRPTELLLIGLGACMITFANDYSRLKGLPTNLQINLEDRMEKGYPGLAGINVSIEGPLAEDPEALAELIRIIQRECKLSRTVTSGTKITFVSPDTVVSVPDRENTTTNQISEQAPGTSCGLQSGKC